MTFTEGMTLVSKYKCYKHCLVWVGESFEEKKLSAQQIGNIMAYGGGGCFAIVMIGIVARIPIFGR